MELHKSILNYPHRLDFRFRLILFLRALIGYNWYFSLGVGFKLLNELLRNLQSVDDLSCVLQVLDFLFQSLLIETGKINGIESSQSIVKASNFLDIFKKRNVIVVFLNFVN